jgi:hypothetical protein
MEIILEEVEKQASINLKKEEIKLRRKNEDLIFISFSELSEEDQKLVSQIFNLINKLNKSKGV